MVIYSYFDPVTKQVIYRHFSDSGDPVMCSVCDSQPARATWMETGEEIGVCYSCAVSVLPKLIADAVASNHYGHLTSLTSPRYRDARQDFARIETAFWQTHSLAVERAVQAKHDFQNHNVASDDLDDAEVN